MRVVRVAQSSASRRLESRLRSDRSPLSIKSPTHAHCGKYMNHVALCLKSPALVLSSDKSAVGVNTNA